MADAKNTPSKRSLSALKVRQWLSDWDKIKFDAEERREKPAPQFYLSSVPAVELLSLSGISRRSAKNAASRSADLGIQRQHDPERSEEISRFVDYGYPWSTLSESKRRSHEFNDLRKPGWLPTAVVINILTAKDQRNGASVDSDDLVEIRDDGEQCSLVLPYQEWKLGWKPKSLPPFEVIDGQHRLWAFDVENPPADFDLPVVAFVGLDISWQAYLFWTINIKPKRINSSLAFDLYPLLRAENWLDRAEGHAIYRETRAQELVEALWSHPESPWYDKINMLGERENPWPSQSAWIKSLMATLVRPWEGRGAKLGGLFGGRVTDDEDVLGWSRAQQAAFLIQAWQSLKKEVTGTELSWAQTLRGESKSTLDLALYGTHSLLATDQGIRGVLHVLNDLVLLSASRLNLRNWKPGPSAGANDVAAVSAALAGLKKEPVAEFLEELAKALVDFDWRTSAAAGLTEEQRRAKLVFRGSSGYKELRAQLLEHTSKKPGNVGATAHNVIGRV